MSAVHQVLDTYELLENILLYLPLRRLLLAQCVSTSFRDLIQRSSNTSRALFFCPATTETVDWYQPEDAQEPREIPYQGEWKTEEGGKTVQPMLNPFVPVYKTSLLTAIGDKWDRDNNMEWDFDWEPQDRRKLLDGPQDLAFSTPPRRFFCDYWNDECQRLSGNDDGKLHPFLDKLWYEAMKASSGSFKDMLVTHPPCRGIKITSDNRIPAPRGEYPSPYCARDVDVDEEDWGVHFGPFIGAAIEVSIEQRWWHGADFAREGETNTVEIMGGELWRLCPKTIDEITGWEMLSLLLEDSG